MKGNIVAQSLITTKVYPDLSVVNRCKQHAKKSIPFGSEWECFVIDQQEILLTAKSTKDGHTYVFSMLNGIPLKEGSSLSILESELCFAGISTGRLNIKRMADGSDNKKEGLASIVNGSTTIHWGYKGSVGIGQHLKWKIPRVSTTEQSFEGISQYFGKPHQKIIVDVEPFNIEDVRSIFFKAFDRCTIPRNFGGVSDISITGDLNNWSGKNRNYKSSTKIKGETMPLTAQDLLPLAIKKHINTIIIRGVEVLLNRGIISMHNAGNIKNDGIENNKENKNLQKILDEDKNSSGTKEMPKLLFDAVEEALYLKSNSAIKRLFIEMYKDKKEKKKSSYISFTSKIAKKGDGYDSEENEFDSEAKINLNRTKSNNDIETSDHTVKPKEVKEKYKNTKNNDGKTTRFFNETITGVKTGRLNIGKKDFFEEKDKKSTVEITRVPYALLNPEYHKRSLDYNERMSSQIHRHERLLWLSELLGVVGTNHNDILQSDILNSVLWRKNILNNKDIFYEPLFGIKMKELNMEKQREYCANAREHLSDMMIYLNACNKEITDNIFGVTLSSAPGVILGDQKGSKVDINVGIKYVPI